FKRLDGPLAVDDAQDIVVLVLPGRTPGEHGVLNTHHHRVVAVLAVDGHTVQALLGAGEEPGDVEELLVVLRHIERIAVLFLKRGHLLGVLEQVTAVSPTVGVTLGGVGPVRARAGGVFSVVGQRGGRDRIGNAGAGQELGQVHVVALGRAGTEPLAVTNDDIPATATGA